MTSLLDHLAAHTRREDVAADLVAQGANPRSLRCTPSADATWVPRRLRHTLLERTTDAALLAEHAGQYSFLAMYAAANPACPQPERLAVLERACSDGEDLTQAPLLPALVLAARHDVDAALGCLDLLWRRDRRKAFQALFERALRDGHMDLVVAVHRRTGDFDEVLQRDLREGLDAAVQKVMPSPPDAAELLRAGVDHLAVQRAAVGAGTDPADPAEVLALRDEGLVSDRALTRTRALFDVGFDEATARQLLERDQAAELAWFVAARSGALTTKDVPVDLIVDLVHAAATHPETRADEAACRTALALGLAEATRADLEKLGELGDERLTWLATSVTAKVAVRLALVHPQLTQQLLTAAAEHFGTAAVLRLLLRRPAANAGQEVSTALAWGEQQARDPQVAWDLLESLALNPSLQTLAHPIVGTCVRTAPAEALQLFGDAARLAMVADHLAQALDELLEPGEFGTAVALLEDGWEGSLDELATVTRSVLSRKAG